MEYPEGGQGLGDGCDPPPALQPLLRYTARSPPRYPTHSVTRQRIQDTMLCLVLCPAPEIPNSLPKFPPRTPKGRERNPKNLKVAATERRMRSAGPTGRS